MVSSIVVQPNIQIRLHWLLSTDIVLRSCGIRLFSSNLGKEDIHNIFSFSLGMGFTLVLVYCPTLKVSIVLINASAK